MPQIRVTEGSITTRVMANLQRNVARSGKLQEQLSSGKLISRPSDSPSGTLSSMQLRGEARVNEQYSRNADDGLGWLGTVDNILTTSLTQLNRVRELGIQSQNGAASQESREALAVEVENIRDGLIGVANTTYLGRPVFGGTTTLPAAYDSTGVYLGDTGDVMRTIGNGSQVRVGEVGPNVFGTGPDQLFTVLSDIATSLRANNTPALQASMDKLNASGDLIKSTLADVGARYNRVSQAKDTAQRRVDALKNQVSDIEDVDLPKTIMEMQLQQTAYQSALAATAKVIQPSLLDYLR
ncbi:flagellar hook-associated protein 3 FlgL [Krasilnikovia cinnamomea]|uniref:Flagellar hook-associated protein 3 FlgL n=1 Tax=Krasilnikovia cinnamomea TaxID=349313 RepID=A0A4Q7ZJM0_9ACTN|nr:flagellar hook-associated protein FlgL [Krasilnikovia cinnamomea]RZU50445.1 flagellar hook-associated protein 3 FlgL [Krasilnikovia cinnamomea]